MFRHCCSSGSWTPGCPPHHQNQNVWPYHRVPRGRGGKSCILVRKYIKCRVGCIKKWVFAEVLLHLFAKGEPCALFKDTEGTSVPLHGPFHFISIKNVRKKNFSEKLLSGWYDFNRDAMWNWNWQTRYGDVMKQLLSCSPVILLFALVPRQRWGLLSWSPWPWRRRDFQKRSAWKKSGWLIPRVSLSRCLILSLQTNTRIP